MFESYRFDNHSTDQAIVLGGSSYVWSALGGPLYVLAYGFKLAAAAMVGFTALLAIAAFVAITVAVGLFDSAMKRLCNCRHHGRRLRRAGRDRRPGGAVQPDPSRMA